MISFVLGLKHMRETEARHENVEAIEVKSAFLLPCVAVSRLFGGCLEAIDASASRYRLYITG